MITAMHKSTMGSLCLKHLLFIYSHTYAGACGGTRHDPHQVPGADPEILQGGLAASTKLY